MLVSGNVVRECGGVVLPISEQLVAVLATEVDPEPDENQVDAVRTSRSKRERSLQYACLLFYVTAIFVHGLHLLGQRLRDLRHGIRSQ